MSLAWQTEKERGSRLAVRSMTWVALRLGRPVARLLLYPVCLYYLLRSRRANLAVRHFLERVRGHPGGWRDVYRQYLCFASTILDRVYFLCGRFEKFDITVHGLADFDRAMKQGRGCLLLGAHLGSFEAVRALGLAREAYELRVLMDEHNAPLFRSLIHELNPAVADTVIQVGSAAAMLQVKECVDRGGLVGAMGDRLMKDDQAVLCRFLGETAHFPAGPMRLAHVLRAPVVLFFGLYRGANRYEVYLEWFSDEARLSPDEREADLKRWTQQYADRLEVYCRMAPENWFNFYEFWSHAA